VRLVGDEAFRCCDTHRFIERLHYSKGCLGERMAGRCGLADHITCRGHGLAAVLTVMTMPHALHRLAALHRLLSRRPRSAIEGVSGESDRENSRKDVSRKSHLD